MAQNLCAFILASILIAVPISEACNVYVSNNGSDTLVCGTALASACQTIQKGIDRALVSDVVCVYGPGPYSCGGSVDSFAGLITKSLTVQGEGDPVIDCQGSGGGLKIIGGETAPTQVTVRGLHFRNGNSTAAGGISIDQFNSEIQCSEVLPDGLPLYRTPAGAYDPSQCRRRRSPTSLRVSQSTVVGCRGKYAGGIAGKVAPGATWVFENLRISDCHGAAHGSWSGGIGVYEALSGSDQKFENVTTVLSNVSVIACTGGSNFNPHGLGGAGGISMLYLVSPIDASLRTQSFSNITYDVPDPISIAHTKTSLSDVTVADCIGGNNNEAGGAGGVALSMLLHSSRGPQYTGRLVNNTVSAVNMKITNCSGGNLTTVDLIAYNLFGESVGTGAGGMALSTSSIATARGSNITVANNTYFINNMTIAGCFGGLDNRASSAGGLAIGYNSQAVFETVEGNEPTNVVTVNNTNMFHDLLLTNCHGGWGSRASGGAGGLAVMYKLSAGLQTENLVSHNEQILSNVSFSACTGGYANAEGAGAGGVSISHSMSSTENGRCNILQNKNIFQRVVFVDCLGGEGLAQGGGAGAVAIDYRANRVGSQAKAFIVGNHELFHLVNITRCLGGGNNGVMGGAGGLSLTYFAHGIASVSAVVRNIITISNTSVQENAGGDLSHGAGGLALVVKGSSSQNEVEVRDSIFKSNVGGTQAGLKGCTGTSGGMRIYMDEIYDAQGRVQQARFRRVSFLGNELSQQCLYATCMSGGLAIYGFQTWIDQALFENNYSPNLAGGLQSDNSVQMSGTAVVGNRANISFSAALVDRLSANNSIFTFGNFGNTFQAALGIMRAGAGDSSTLELNNLTLHCPRGSEVVNPATAESSSQYVCQTCPQGKYNLEHGTWVDRVRGKQCKPCPSLNPVQCSCNADRVVSASGYWTDYITPTETAVVACPNRKACPNSGLIDTACTWCGGVDNYDHFFKCCNVQTSLKCAAAYTGGMCVVCRKNYFSDNLDGLQCKACPDTAASTVVMLLNVFGVYGVSIYLGKAAVKRYKKSVKIEQDLLDLDKHQEKQISKTHEEAPEFVEHSQPTSSLHMKEDLEMPVDDFELDAQHANRRLHLEELRLAEKQGHSKRVGLMGSSFKMLMVHGLFLKSISNTNWQWDGLAETSSTTASVFSGSTFDFNVGCAYGFDLPGKLYWAVCKPLMLAATALLASGLMSRLAKSWSFRDTIRMFGTVGVYIFGPEALTYSLMAVPCYDVSDGRRYMINDPQSECHSNQELIIVGSVAFVVYLAVSIWTIPYGLWRIKNLVNCPSEYSEKRLQTVFEQFGFLYQDYERRFYWWECLVFLQKLGLLIICQFNPSVTDNSWRALMLSFNLMAMLVLTARFRPYLLSKLDTLQIMTTCTSLVSILTAQFVQQQEEQVRDQDSYLKYATIIFILFNFLLAMLHASMLWPEVVYQCKYEWARCRLKCRNGSNNDQSSGSDTLDDPRNKASQVVELTLEANPVAVGGDRGGPERFHVHENGRPHASAEVDQIMKRTALFSNLRRDGQKACPTRVAGKFNGTFRLASEKRQKEEAAVKVQAAARGRLERQRMARLQLWHNDSRARLFPKTKDAVMYL